MRDGALRLLSLTRRWNPRKRELQFLNYHHVLDDERQGFSIQLGHLKNVGEFLCLGDAVDVLRNRVPVDGRYFCLTFDDGFRNCFVNAAPILAEMGVPAGMFVAPSCVGAESGGCSSSIEHFFRNARSYPLPMEFLSWDELRKMSEEGFVIGSHGWSHQRLADLPEVDAEREMKDSKTVLERELGSPCDHFACPFGIPGRDFHVGREPVLAEKLGYGSFLTSVRGSASPETSPYLVPRHTFFANEGFHILRYFLAKNSDSVHG